MDDIIVISNQLHFLQNFTTKFHATFALKDLGPLHFFLGIQVHRTHSMFQLSQSQYIHDLLLKFGMLNSSPCPTPMAANSSLVASDGKSLPNPTPVQTTHWCSSVHYIHAAGYEFCCQQVKSIH